MRTAFRGAALLILGALVCAALPAADDKTADKSDKKDSAKPATKTKPKEKFEYLAFGSGKLTKLESSTKNFTVQITNAVVDPQRAQENQIHYARRITEISGIKNPFERQRQLVELTGDMQRRTANAVKKVTMDVDFHADDNVKVRIAQPPTEYDDKENPKKHTKAQLAALKGPDKSLPGYTADYEQLQNGQYITVYIAKPKQGKTKTSDKPAPKTDDPDIGINRPKAVMILIVADPPAQ